MAEKFPQVGGKGGFIALLVSTLPQKAHSGSTVACQCSRLSNTSITLASSSSRDRDTPLAQLIRVTPHSPKETFTELEVQNQTRH